MLELRPIDRDMLAGIAENVTEVTAERPNPGKKNLLRRLAKKVPVHDRRTVEAW